MNETNVRPISNLFPIAMALVIVFVGLFVSSKLLERPTFSQHAQTSHVNQIEKINKCFDGGGDIGPMLKTSGGRWAQYCSDERSNHWRIYDCEKEGGVVVITQFTQRIGAKLNYMRNHKMHEKEMTC